MCLLAGWLDRVWMYQDKVWMYQDRVWMFFSNNRKLNVPMTWKHKNLNNKLNVLIKWKMGPPNTCWDYIDNLQGKLSFLSKPWFLDIDLKYMAMVLICQITLKNDVKSDSMLKSEKNKKYKKEMRATKLKTWYFEQISIYFDK